RALTEERAFAVNSAPQRELPGEPYLAFVPLRTDSQSQRIGSIRLGRYVASYSHKELELLTTVGEQIGSAIALSRLLRRQSTDVESLERALAESSTALSEAAERVAGLEEERASLQSLASLGELAAGVAHDLNNALNPVVAFAEL